MVPSLRKWPRFKIHLLGVGPVDPPDQRDEQNTENTGTMLASPTVHQHRPPSSQMHDHECQDASHALVPASAIERPLCNRKIPTTTSPPLTPRLPREVEGAATPQTPHHPWEVDMERPAMWIVESGGRGEGGRPPKEVVVDRFQLWGLLSWMCSQRCCCMSFNQYGKSYWAQFTTASTLDHAHCSACRASPTKSFPPVSSPQMRHAMAPRNTETPQHRNTGTPELRS